MIIRKVFSLGIVLVLGACAGQGEQKPAFDDTKAATGKAEAWGSRDRPTLFSTDLQLKVDSLPLVGEATNIPWAGNYWPTHQDNINHRWDGPSTDSPAKKFELAYGLSGVEDAVSKNHGIDKYTSRTECTQNSDCNSKIGESCSKRGSSEKGRCIPTWWGICHAWAPAAILAPEPKRPVTVNGVTFKVNDIKALVSLVHEKVKYKFVSLRCDQDAESEEGIPTDEFGRPAGDCRDTNAGTWHLLATNYLGVRKEAFVYDRTWDDEVWNQPLRGYRITQQTEITAQQANTLVGATNVGGTTVTKSGTVAKAAWEHYAAIDVTAGDSVKVVMSGSNDADLYLRFGEQATASSYDCRPYAGTSIETCELTVPEGATKMFVSVNGYADSSDFEVKISHGGRTPEAYHFNDKAVKFFHVKMEVDYITESNASTDGNLSSRIDSYTRTDRLEYIIEVNAAGEIIGGEWVGASKRAHPDFLWLPTGVSGANAAGGKISYARVKEILDRSIEPEVEEPTTGEEKTVTKSGRVAKEAWQHFGPFEVAPGQTLTADMTGDNDADLYVRRGASPTASTFDCRPYKGTSTESCSLVGPGKVFVSVRGYAAESNFKVVVKYREGTGTLPPVDPPVSIQHLNVNAAVALGETKVYQIEVPAGTNLRIQTAAPDDVDLYIQMNQAPTTSAYLQRAWTTSGNETLRYNVTSTGVLYVMVHGYKASSFTLTTAVE